MKKETRSSLASSATGLTVLAVICLIVFRHFVTSSNHFLLSAIALGVALVALVVACAATPGKTVFKTGAGLFISGIIFWICGPQDIDHTLYIASIILIVVCFVAGIVFMILGRDKTKAVEEKKPTQIRRY